MRNKFTIKEVREFWDTVVNKYESSHVNIESTHHQRFEEAVQHLDLKSCDRVLNIWCRTGEAIPYLREKCPTINLHNLEVSPNFISIAKERFPKEAFGETNFINLDFEDNFFDFVLSLETLEHVPEPSQFLKEIHRVLKKGGTLVMSLPPATAEFPHKIYSLFVDDHGEGPHRFLTSKTVKNLLTEAGFRLTLHKGTLLVPLGPVLLQRLGERIIDKFQNTFLSEFGIRQFFIAEKS